MTKEEFLSGLRTALTGEIPDNEVNTNIRFYEDYIKDKCRVEEELDVLSQLGDPRLIAKTIIETYQISHGPLYNNVKSNRTYQDADTREWNGTDNIEEEYNSYGNTNPNNTSSNFNFRVGGRLTWYQKALLILILAIVVIVLVIIGGFIMKALFTIGIPLLLIYLGYTFIFGNKRL
ncbi:MAG: hypothetical protein K0S61_2049 [Anaerocolumna sp.]|jgi:hypothetical protein|nr:hypothetical protein [Anaerocolumna sp.]